jgi:hypothetical protein
MDARSRLRGFLLGREADRPPFLPLSLDLTARLGQVSTQELLGDPHLLAQAFLESTAVCGFEVMALALPAEPVEGVIKGRDPAESHVLSSVREGLNRLRALVDDRQAMIVLLPGPLMMTARLARPEEQPDLEGAVARLLAVLQFLDPPVLDAVAVLEGDRIRPESLGKLAEGLATLWNTARYYSIPSLFIAAAGTHRVAEIGADAVVVWEGASPRELLAGGARRVGVPVHAHVWPDVPQLPDGGFYTTAGEIPAHSEIDDVQRLVARIALPGGS